MAQAIRATSCSCDNGEVCVLEEVTREGEANTSRGGCNYREPRSGGCHEAYNITACLYGG